MKHGERTLWHQLVAYEVGRCPFPPRRAHVSVVRVSNRLIDPLNVYAGLKWLLDAFVEMGWLTGDGYDDLTISADQRRCEKGEVPHMEVAIAYLRSEAEAVKL